ncbi:MAG TPA: TIGR00266 family protein [Epulopiscium sp.]|nr:TIGR00266 family protein [Candidatus Epulonipiscium sp.]
MKYEIKGGNLPFVSLKLDQGEELFTTSGAMSWMSTGVSMETTASGGLFGGVKRVFSGESFFTVNFKALADHQTIAFSSSFPGSIYAVKLEPGKSIIAQKRAFLVGEKGVDLAIHFQKKLGAGFFGGEGFIMQRLSGTGYVFLEIDGALEEIELAAGEILKVDTGHVAFYEETVQMSIDSIKGFKNIFFGGEGLFLTTLTGPGKIYLQSMPIQNFAGSIIPFLPTSSSN